MLTPFNLAVFVISMLFMVGMVTFIAGVLILALRATSSDVKELALQTTRLAQKGLAEDVAGLVGNATDLLDAMNQLVRTMRGIGIFLMLAGLSMMLAAGYLSLLIYRTPL